MGYPRTIIAEDLEKYGFVIDPDNPELAYNQKHPNSVRHQCNSCGNWTSTFNGQCRQCRLGRKPLANTKSNFKLYLCCGDKSCKVRQKAFKYLKTKGFDTMFLGGDGRGGPFVHLENAMDWSSEERQELFRVLRSDCLTQFAGYKLKHPGSKGKSKLPN